LNLEDLKATPYDANKVGKEHYLLKLSLELSGRVADQNDLKVFADNRTNEAIYHQLATAFQTEANMQLRLWEGAKTHEEALNLGKRRLTWSAVGMRVKNLKDALKAVNGEENPELMSVAEATKIVEKCEEAAAEGNPLTPPKPKGKTSVRALLAPYHKHGASLVYGPSKMPVGTVVAVRPANPEKKHHKTRQTHLLLHGQLSCGCKHFNASRNPSSLFVFMLYIKNAPTNYWIQKMLDSIKLSLNNTRE
jgi:hypothetical protein